MNTPWPVWASRILLVDDYPDSAPSMADVLKLWGYMPLIAFDGITGLKMALTRRPDAIILEVRLPGIDGCQMARRIRAEAGMERMPLLALTEMGRPCDRQACLAAGFDHHLLKPADLGRLRRLLAELLRGRAEPLWREGEEDPSLLHGPGWLAPATAATGCTGNPLV